MNGIKKIKFNGIDRLYDAYSWRLTRRAKKVWSTGQVLQGPQLQELEHKFKKKYKRKHAVAVGSATDGLYFAMCGHGLTQRSRIACPVLSYVATSGAIKRVGATINYIDTDHRGNIGSLDFQQKPDAVLYVNLYGNPADYTRIKEYCDANKVTLIEDAAQSMGAYYGGIPSGRLGETSVFSFDPMKNLPCFGSGGIVLTDNDYVYEKAIALRRHGIKGSMVDYGYNSLIPEDHCAQLNFLFDKFDTLQKKRKTVFEWYKSFLPDGTIVEAEKDTKSSFHKLVIFTRDRDKLQDYLLQKGIETKVHYRELLDTGLGKHYPNAEKLRTSSISLPIYPFLEKQEVKFICETIRNFHGI
jgi:dTDP-4-amino-4,6-dideoxygalactose transaminase